MSSEAKNHHTGDIVRREQNSGMTSVSSHMGKQSAFLVNLHRKDEARLNRHVKRANSSSTEYSESNLHPQKAMEKASGKIRKRKPAPMTTLKIAPEQFNKKCNKTEDEGSSTSETSFEATSAYERNDDMEETGPEPGDRRLYASWLTPSYQPENKSTAASRIRQNKYYTPSRVFPKNGYPESPLFETAPVSARQRQQNAKADDFVASPGMTFLRTNTSASDSEADSCSSTRIECKMKGPPNDNGAGSSSVAALSSAASGNSMLPVSMPLTTVDGYGGSANPLAHGAVHPNDQLLRQLRSIPTHPLVPHQSTIARPNLLRGTALPWGDTATRSLTGVEQHLDLLRSHSDLTASGNDLGSIIHASNSVMPTLESTCNIGSQSCDRFSPSTTNRTYITGDPRPQDVEAFKGNQMSSQRSNGNKLFRGLLKRFNASFSSTNSRKHKTNVCRTLVQFIVQSGGRFIKKSSDDGRFFLLTEAEVMRKTSKALNDASKQALKREIAEARHNQTDFVGQIYYSIPAAHQRLASVPGEEPLASIPTVDPLLVGNLSLHLMEQQTASHMQYLPLVRPSFLPQALLGITAPQIAARSSARALLALADLNQRARVSAAAAAAEMKRTGNFDNTPG